MTERPPITDKATLSNFSLGLGIASAALVFGIGFCSLVGAQQGWIFSPGGTLAYICGTSSAFLGFIAMLLGGAALIAKETTRTAAAMGVVFGGLGICMFLFALAAIGG